MCNVDLLPGTSVAHELNPKIPRDKLTWHGEYGFEDFGIIRTDELEEKRASDEFEPLSISFIQRLSNSNKIFSPTRCSFATQSTINELH